MNKLKFKFGNGVFEFEVEGDDDFVKEKTEWATSFVTQSKETLIASRQQQLSIEDAIQSPAIRQYSSPVQFLLEKKFSVEADVTLALAYYLEVYGNKEPWTTNDLASEYSAAKKKLPTNLSRNITYNMQKAFIINPNRDDKRSYCLTAEGRAYVENFIGKDSESNSRNKIKRTSVAKPIDADEQAKIDEVKSNIASYNQEHLTLLEGIKGQKDQTLLSAYVIRSFYGEEYEFTPRVISGLAKKLGISLDHVQVIKMISGNSKCFDNERRGWYKFNDIGCRYVRENILAAGE